MPLLAFEPAWTIQVDILNVCSLLPQYGSQKLLLSNQNLQTVFIIEYDKVFPEESNELFPRFPPFYNDFFLQKCLAKDWIFHFAVIYGPKLCKRDGIKKTRLTANIDGYLLGFS